MIHKLLILIIFCFVSSFNVYAQEFTDALNAKKYQNCIAQVDEDDAAALDVAREWFIEGGGVAAQHCAGLALHSQERYEEAADVFEAVVDNLSTGEGVNDFASKNSVVLKAQMNYLAGISWRSAEKLDRAYSAFSASIIGLSTEAVFAYDLYIERGLLQFARAEYKTALEDFNKAMEVSDEKFDAFLYRAETYRKLDEHIKARLDLNVALAIEPNHPDVLFESGVNYRMQHNDEKALVEWEQLIIKYPGTRWQALAEENIKLIGQ